jgi:phosphohistidine phosphatase
VVSDRLPDRPRIVTSGALAPAGTTAGVLEEIARHRGAARLALVGHEPNIGELAAALVGARTAIPFKKGAVCRIDFEALPPGGAGELRWFLPPRALRGLG